MNITINRIPAEALRAIAKTGQRKSAYARKALANQLARDGHKLAAISLTTKTKNK